MNPRVNEIIEAAGPGHHEVNKMNITRSEDKLNLSLCNLDCEALLVTITTIHHLLLTATGHLHIHALTFDNPRDCITSL